MKKLPILALLPALLCVCSCSSPNKDANNSVEPEKVVLHDAFKNTNFCIVAGNWNETGVALLFDEKLNPKIQNGSAHVDFYDIEFALKPLRKSEKDSKTMFFLPFKCTDQVIDDGYFKNDIDYKFWLSYEESTYFCGVSKDDDRLTEPEKVLTEGLM